jgi:pantoate--beta-alanine ligase
VALERGVDCLFVPAEAAVYPVRPNVRIDPGALAAHLCGPHRPGHFEGVLTVVAKLLHMVEPQVAVFGRKDAQQAIIIQRMVTELNFPVRVDVVPTVREHDGLALSSRNAYLSDEDRRAAPAIARGLDAAHRAFRSGVRDASQLIAVVREVITAEPQFRIEYIEAVDPASLSPVDEAGSDTIIAVAAYLGGTRLIDNIVLAEGTTRDPRIEPLA